MADHGRLGANNAPAISGSRPLGEDEARAIAARYGVICAPDVPVMTARPGVMATAEILNYRDISNSAFSAMVRRNRFRRADAKKSE